jgi:hypothetical protein
MRPASVSLLQRRKRIHCSIGGVGRCVRGRNQEKGRSTVSSLAGLCPCESVYQILLSSSSSSMGWAAWRVPSVRVFNEGSLRPRVARAQETFDSFLSQLLSPIESRLILFVSLGRSGQGALYCAHRTSTFLSCAFCEQEGHLAASSLFLPAALAHPFKGGLVAPRLRASNEHILIVRVPRAGGRPGCPSFSIIGSRRAATSLLGFA